MPVLLLNKKARHEYAIEKTYRAGIVLSGAEVKSLRGKSGSLSGSYVRIIGGEAFLLNAQISPYSYANNTEYDPKRTRKLLLHKKELHQLAEKLQQKRLTLVPLQVVTVGRHIKLELGLGKGLKQFEKKDKLKQRDLKRQVAREVRSSV